jgi:hypothetical protein
MTQAALATAMPERTERLKACLIEPGDAIWTDILRRTAYDFYHLPEYVSLCAEQEGGEPLALHVQGGDRELLLPLVLRPVQTGSWDVTSPYGYPGPLLVNTSPAEAFLDQAMRHGIALLKEQHVISMFVRLHPILNRDFEVRVGTPVRHGDTVDVDLTLSTDEIWSGMRKSHRSQIKKLELEGVTVLMDDSLRYFAKFRELYHRTMDRVSADAYYYFDERYFDGLRSALGDRLCLAVVLVDGEVACTALVVRTGEIVQLHLSATDERFHAGYAKVLRHRLILWAKDRGATWFHLGGGLGRPNDSLLEFKGGFSPRREVYRTLRVIIRPEDYAAIALSRDPTADPTVATDFFPLYRRRGATQEGTAPLTKSLLDH